MQVVWKPLPGSQVLALSCPAQMILYHGTRGPGKTDAQLMRFRRWVGLGFGAFWRGVIFDREYKNLDDLVSKSMRWFPKFEDGAIFLSSKSDYKWKWPTGEELFFRAIKRESDYWSYHGQEFPFIGWNELTKYPDDKLFNNLMSCNRSSFRPEDYPIINEDGTTSYLPEIPLQVFATCNPHGPGHNWVKKRFINQGQAGEVIKRAIDVYNPRTEKDETVVKTSCHIFGSYKENKYLSPHYVAELESIAEPNKKKAWLNGSWDIVAGGMFDDVWETKYHVIPKFKVPKTWKINRSFDWGSSKPFSVGWWAHSDGSAITLDDGRVMPTIKGDVFRVAEWYGTSGQINQGLKLLATEVAKGIIEKEIALGLYGRVSAGPADNAIWTADGGNSIATEMSKPIIINGQKYPGVTWLRSKKSRISGWERFRICLENAKPKVVETNGTLVSYPREYPGLFVCSNCKHFIELVPILARDEKNPDDIDSNTEDHIADETRYLLMSLNLGAKTGTTIGLT